MIDTKKDLLYRSQCTFKCTESWGETIRLQAHRECSRQRYIQRYITCMYLWPIKGFFLLYTLKKYKLFTQKDTNYKLEQKQGKGEEQEKQVQKDRIILIWGKLKRFWSKTTSRLYNQHGK